MQSWVSLCSRTVLNMLCTSLEPGRFLNNDDESGQDLVNILQCMRSGNALSWIQRCFRGMSGNLFSNANWCAFSWEQVSRLQQLRAAHEAEAAGQTLYYVQAVDRATGSHELTAEETAASLKLASMSTTGYLMGMVPLFLGMEVRISDVFKTPLLWCELPGTWNV